MRSKEAKQREQALPILQEIQESSYLQDLLVTATSDVQKTFFLSTTPDSLAGWSETPPELLNIMTIWFGKYKDDFSQFSAVEIALQQCKDYSTIHWHKKMDFICRIGLDWSSMTRDSFLGATRIIYLSKLDKPLPCS